MFRPRETWPLIAAEDPDIGRIFKSYLIYLAAIPAVAGFVGQSLVGVGVLGVTVRVPLLRGLIGMVIGFALSLAMVYLMAVIASSLAPKFKGEANLPSAFKLMAYGATAGMVGGIFSIVPVLAVLGLLAALYSVYLIYLGVPVLMRVPQEKAVGYTAVLVVCGILAGLAVGMLTSLITPMGRASSGMDSVSIQVPGTDIKVDTSRLEEATRKLEKAQASGDTEAATKAASEMLGVALGGKAGVATFPAQQLRDMLPATAIGMPRTSIEASAQTAMGIQFSEASAQYEQGDKSMEVQIQDIGAATMLASAMAAWSRTTSERETDEEVERIYREGDAVIKEEWSKDGSSADLAMLLPNGLLLSANGAVSIDELKRVVDPMRKQLASLKRPG